MCVCLSDASQYIVRTTSEYRTCLQYIEPDTLSSSSTSTHAVSPTTTTAYTVTVTDATKLLQEQTKELVCELQETTAFHSYFNLSFVFLLNRRLSRCRSRLLPGRTKNAKTERTSGHRQLEISCCHGTRRTVHACTVRWLTPEAAHQVFHDMMSRELDESNQLLGAIG